MPDLLTVFFRRWKLLLLLPLIATAVALLACLLLPKEYAGETTALPANSLTGDKARIFNVNIQALYPEIGSGDELDKMEGTARLDTLYSAAVDRFHLVQHYGLTATKTEAWQSATKKLKKKTEIKRTGYGELRITVWDKDQQMAADLANFLLQTLNDIHQHLQTENNRLVLQKLKDAASGNDPSTTSIPSQVDTTLVNRNKTLASVTNGEQEQAYRQLIAEYEIALRAAPKVLLVVERAKPQLQRERPDLTSTLLLTFLASFLFSLLLALFVESRKAVV